MFGDQMDHTCLHRGLRESCSDRVGQPLQAVADDEEDVLCAAVAQLGQHLQPELRGLATTGAPAQIPSMSLWPARSTPVAA